MRFTIPAALAALLLPGCLGSGGLYTQEQIDAAALQAGNAAAAKAQAESLRRVLGIFLDLGMTQEEAAKLAQAEAASAARLAKATAEELTRRALEPLRKKENGDAEPLRKTLSVLGTVALNLGLGYLEARSRKD